MKNIHWAIIATIIIFFISIYLLDYLLEDLQKTIGILNGIIQMLAIVIGGLWAYHKFGWEKRSENIITLKASLMEFARQHNDSAAQYNNDKDIVGYKVRLLNSYNQMLKKIHLSYYVPKNLRNRILETLWLTIGNVHGKNLENLYDNWAKFEQELKKIFEKFDAMI